MPYAIKPASALDQIQPGDSITADVVVEPAKYWLENVKVTGHSKAPSATPTATVQPNEGRGRRQLGRESVAGEVKA